MLNERGDIGGEEALAVTDPDHEWRVTAGRDDLVGLVGADRDQRECPLQASDHRPHRVDQAGPGDNLAVQQLSCHLGVGLRGELGAQPLPEGRVVLEDTVVHHGDAARDVRMRVHVRGRPMGGPAGMADGGA